MRENEAVEGDKEIDERERARSGVRSLILCQAALLLTSKCSSGKEERVQIIG